MTKPRNRSKSICMLVTSELHLDPRVQKEAISACTAGYDVTVVCRDYVGGSQPYHVRPLKIRRQTTRIMKYFERIWTNVQLIRAVIAIRPSLVHANDLDTLMAGFLASRIVNARLVYDAHELWVEAGRDVGKERAVIERIEGFLVRRCDAVITVSKYISDIIRDRYQVPAPVYVMNVPFHVEVTKADSTSLNGNMRSSEIRVMHLGVFRSNRGLETAIRSARYLDPRAHLYFIGYGAEEQALRQLVIDEGLSHRVTILPAVELNQVVVTASQYDVGLVLYQAHNLNNMFASPNKLFEYMMAGVAVVGADLPFLREIIIEEQIGDVYVSPTPECIAATVNNIVSDHKLLTMYKENALRASHKYTWESESKKLLKIYNQLITDAPKVCDTTSSEDDHRQHKV